MSVYIKFFCVKKNSLKINYWNGIRPKLNTFVLRIDRSY